MNTVVPFGSDCYSRWQKSRKRVTSKGRYQTDTGPPVSTHFSFSRQRVGRRRACGIGKGCFSAEAGLMQEGEFERLKAAFKALPVRDDAGLNRLFNELDTVVRLAVPATDIPRWEKRMAHA